MPLDPDILAMAEEVRALSPPPISQVTVAQARAGYSARYRERSLPAPDGVTVEPLTIPRPGGVIDARLYRPRDLPADAPVIVYFHGGGFVLGDADAYELQSMHLAALTRCALIFPEFRLAPEHRFPAAVDDAIRAVEWVSVHAADIGVSRERLVVMGDSAGGNLSINVCLHAREHRGPRIALQVLLYPWMDFRPYCNGPSYPSVDAFSSGFLLDRAVMEWFAGYYLTKPEQAIDPRVSPLLAADLRDLPRTLLITAENDPLRDMGARCAADLATAGVDVDYHCAAGMAHNFMGHVARSGAAWREFERVARRIDRELSRMPTNHA